jgi:hypothetical protein
MIIEFRCRYINPNRHLQTGATNHWDNLHQARSQHKEYAIWDLRLPRESQTHGLAIREFGDLRDQISSKSVKWYSTCWKRLNESYNVVQSHCQRMAKWGGGGCGERGDLASVSSILNCNPQQLQTLLAFLTERDWTEWASPPAKTIVCNKNFLLSCEETFV